MSKYWGANDEIISKPASNSKYWGANDEIISASPNTKQSDLEVSLKSLASGTVENVDLPQNILSLLERFGYDPEFSMYGVDDRRSNYVSSLPPLSSKIKERVDIEPHPAPEQEGLANITHTVGSFLGMPFGGPINKGIGFLANFGKTAAKDFGKSLGKTASMGTAVGGTAEGLKTAGVDPLKADLISAVGVPFAPSALPLAKHLGEKSLLGLGGLTRKNFNYDAAKAAKQLGIDLPPVALTESPIVGFAHHYTKKLPFLNNSYTKAYNTADEQLLGKIKDLYNRVGPEDNPEIRQKISNEYLKSRELLPTEPHLRNHYPAHTMEEGERIKSILNKSDIPHPSEKKVYNLVDNLLEGISPNTQYGRIKTPYDISRSIANKQSLNTHITWDDEVRGAVEHLKKQRKGVVKDLEKFGESNPAWFQQWKNADKLHGSVERRKDLEKLLSGAVDKYDNISYPVITKGLNFNDKGLQKQLSHITGTPENREMAQNLSKIAKTMGAHKKNVPNPSGTAYATAALSFLGGLVAAPIATLQTAGVGLGAGYLFSKLGTDKRFVDLAIKHIEKPTNLRNTIALNKRVQDVTGYSIAELNKNFNQSREANSGL